MTVFRFHTIAKYVECVRLRALSDKYMVCQNFQLPSLAPENLVYYFLLRISKDKPENIIGLC